MKVFIKNKLISIGGSSDVFDERKESIFKIKGKVVSPTKKKIMYDKNGNLLYIIRNRFWNFFADKVFVYDAQKNKVATIKKGKFSFSAKYQIQDCVDSMEINGKIFSRTSKIIRNGQEVGVITREFSFIEDAYSLEAEEQDIPFLTALVIAFDNLRDKIQDDD